jgi:hypothetical protein
MCICEMSAVGQCLTKECESGSVRQKRVSFKVFLRISVFQIFLTKFFNNINGGTFPPSQKEKQK